MRASIPLSRACKARALPFELIPQALQNSRSNAIQSLINIFGNQFTTLDHGYFFFNVAQFKLENQPQLSRNSSVGGASD